jgi:hypothetical protein
LTKYGNLQWECRFCGQFCFACVVGFRQTLGAPPGEQNKVIVFSQLETLVSVLIMRSGGDLSDFFTGDGLLLNRLYQEIF